jgi:hypothetical protein
MATALRLLRALRAAGLARCFSWVNVPHSDVSMGDERERCAACTKKHGPAKAMPGYVEHLVQALIPNAGHQGRP